jgi:hypothetical protein
MLSSAEPVLLNVMAGPGLAVPTTSFPNEILGTDKAAAGDPLTDKLAVGDPPQAAKKTTPQATTARYLFMVVSPAFK